MEQKPESSQWPGRPCPPGSQPSPTHPLPISLYQHPVCPPLSSAWRFLPRTPVTLPSQGAHPALPSFQTPPQSPASLTSYPGSCDQVHSLLMSELCSQGSSHKASLALQKQIKTKTQKQTKTFWALCVCFLCSVPV